MSTTLPRGQASTPGPARTPRTDATTVGYDIVLLLGQSNMQGDSGGAVDPLIDVTDPRIWTFAGSGARSAQLAQAIDPLAHHGGTSVVGPGMEFARWYLGTIPATRRVLLVPAAHSGTAILTGSPSWDPNRPADSANLYAAAIAQAQAAFAAAGAGSRFVAALWVQGENDAGAGIAGTAYRAAFESLIDGLRDRLGAPALPFIVGSLVPELVSAGTGTVAAIHAVHQATPTRKRFTAFVQGPSNMNRGDNLHYTPAGQRVQGRRFLDGYTAALTNTAPPNVVPVSLPGASAPPPAAAPGISDTFTRADSASTLGTTETGGKTWAATTGTWGIAGGQAYNAGGGGSALATIDSGSANSTVSVKVVASDTGSGLIARLTDASNWLMALAPAGGQLQIYRNVGGSVAAVDYPGTAITAGDVVALACSGGTVTYSVNGAVVGSVTDTSTGTRYGFRADTSGARFDNFTVTG